MKILGAVSLAAQPSSATPEQMSNLIIAGRNTGILVPGVVIEAAVEWRDLILIFVTNDIPYEETLGIHLVQPKLGILDSARLAAPYSTGSFSGLALEEPDLVHFRFFGDVDWSVRLHCAARFRLPFWKDARGVWRDGSWSKQFTVATGLPRPSEAATDAPT